MLAATSLNGSRMARCVRLSEKPPEAVGSDVDSHETDLGELGHAASHLAIGYDGTDEYRRVLMPGENLDLDPGAIAGELTNPA